MKSKPSLWCHVTIKNNRVEVRALPAKGCFTLYLTCFSPLRPPELLEEEGTTKAKETKGGKKPSITGFSGRNWAQLVCAWCNEKSKLMALKSTREIMILPKLWFSVWLNSTMLFHPCIRIKLHLSLSKIMLKNYPFCHLYTSWFDKMRQFWKSGMLAITIEWEPSYIHPNLWTIVVRYIAASLGVTEDFVMELWHL